MSDYRCKVRIIRDREITIYAKNKNEAEEEAKDLCKCGAGSPLEEYIEVLEIERMTAKKKEAEKMKLYYSEEQNNGRYYDVPE